ncbi:hypothetical protein ACMYSQ_005237 [Aspergillus niger]
MNKIPVPSLFSGSTCYFFFDFVSLLLLYSSGDQKTAFSAWAVALPLNRPERRTTVAPLLTDTSHWEARGECRLENKLMRSLQGHGVRQKLSRLSEASSSTIT